MLLSKKAVIAKGIEVPDYIDNYKAATLIFVVFDNKLLGLISLEDQIKKEPFAAVSKLQKQGIKTYMFIGDRCHINVFKYGYSCHKC